MILLRLTYYSFKTERKTSKNWSKATEFQASPITTLLTTAPLIDAMQSAADRTVATKWRYRSEWPQL